MFIRFLIFLFGLFFLALGISTVTSAGLGTGTISSVAFVLSKMTGLSLGFYIILTNVFFFVLQILIDRAELFHKALKQLPLCCLFGFVIDLTMQLTSLVEVHAYIAQIVMAIIGTLFAGVGVGSMVYAQFAILPPEGFVLSIIHRFGGSFGNLRTCIDLFLVGSTLALAYAVYGTIVGVGEGTVIMALGAGKISKLVLGVWEKSKLGRH